MPSHCPIATLSDRLTARSDSLLILAYRCWHAGYDYSDADCWRYASTVLVHALGVGEARLMLNAVEDFVYALRQASLGSVDYYPPPCCRASRGERQVLSSLAALQAGSEEAAELGLRELCGEAGEHCLILLSRARKLAMVLSDLGLILTADPGAPASGPPRQFH